MSETYTVGEYYYRISRVGIHRHVKLRAISECGRYATISYSSSQKRHQCRLSELQKDHPKAKR